MPGPRDLGGASGLGPIFRGQLPVGGSPNSEALGARTGAPPRTQVRNIPINGNTPTQIVPTAPDSRVVTVVAPVGGFSIFVGAEGVTTRTGMIIPQGQPYVVTMPGLQDLWAISNAPVWMDLRVQIAAILVGDRERRY